MEYETKSRLTKLIGFLLNLTTILLIFTVIFIATPKWVRDYSMVPTFQDGDFILCQPNYFKWHTYNNGDIIVLRDTAENLLYIKRIIAHSGDHIEVKNNRIYLNDNLLNEPYLSTPTFNTDMEIDLILPDETYFVCGDNRNSSHDSRNGLGLINYKYIIGKVIFPKR